MDRNNQNRGGKRPDTGRKKQPTRQYSIRLTPAVANSLIAQYGNLTEAIKKVPYQQKLF